MNDEADFWTPQISELEQRNAKLVAAIEEAIANLEGAPIYADLDSDTLISSVYNSLCAARQQSTEKP